MNNILNISIWLNILEKNMWIVILAIAIVLLSLIKRIPYIVRVIARIVAGTLLAAIAIIVINIQTCGGCKTIVQADDTYCRSCGNQVYFDEAQMAKYDSLEQCSRCLKYYDIGDSYCHVCGASTELSKSKAARSQCIGCKRYTDYINSFCPHCGDEIVHEVIGEEKTPSPLEDIANETGYKTPLVNKEKK